MLLYEREVTLLMSSRSRLPTSSSATQYGASLLESLINTLTLPSDAVRLWASGKKKVLNFQHEAQVIKSLKLISIVHLMSQSREMFAFFK